MKHLSLLLLSFLSLAAWSQDNPKFDGALAKKLGADEYGMKKYIFVLLKTGSKTTEDQKFVSACFEGHMKNIQKLVDEGKLYVAGPFFRNESGFRGIFILNVETVTEAKQLLESDAAIKEGLLSAEFFEWYGSAALPEYLEASDKVWQKRH